MEFPFTGPTFEIGKLYIDEAKSLISVKISESLGMRVRPAEHGSTNIGAFHFKYRECSLTELTQTELAHYQNVVMPMIQHAKPQVCTCPINVLMLSGCQCGCIKKGSS